MTDPPPSAERWDARFCGDEYVYGTEPNDFLREHAGHLPSEGRTLCLAEGEGRNAAFLAGLGHRVVAVDQSRVGLDKARRLAAERDVVVETVTADLADLHIEPDGWDAVISIWCHLPSAIRVPLHRRVVHGLRPGGVLILEAYTPRQLEYATGGPPDPDRLMSLEHLRRELAGLTLDVAREVEREVHEGLKHQGPGHVVQILARKPSSP